MNATELFLPDGKSAKVWMCDKCGRLFTRQYQPIGDGQGKTYTPDERDQFAERQAERCCNHVCKVCGDKAFSDWQVYCRKCLDAEQQERLRKREQERFEKATKVPFEAWDGNGWLCCPDSDRWFRDYDQFEEWLAEDEDHEAPEYLWLSKRITARPDISSYVGEWIGERWYEDACDDISDADWKKLEAMLVEWWSCVPESWEPDGRVLLLPKEVKGG